MRQLRQPRLAEIVAASLRDDILTGKLQEGDLLPRQEHLFAEFRVSLPAVREAMRILETEGLISVRRGNVGGAVVHLPSAERTARMISMVLQSRGTTLGDVSGTLMHLEPICAGMCAARTDRETETLPYLREAHEAHRAVQDNDDVDAATWTTHARRFHEVIVDRCGSQTMKVVIGSLESIWSAHESTVWGESTMLATDDDPLLSRKLRRAAFRDHERLLNAIEKGDEEEATLLAREHLAATRTSTLASASNDLISANLLDSVALTTAVER